MRPGFLTGFVGMLIVASVAMGFYGVNKIGTLNKQISSLEDTIKVLEKNQASTTDSILETKQELAGKTEVVAASSKAPAKTQDELLISAVAQTAPAVVSIAISKDIPNLEVDYINPFGSNPLFKDFNIRIPVYQQKGTTKQKIGAGSGFIVSSEGYVVTNKHVVSDPAASYTVLLSDGTKKEGKVVYRDKVNDVAILKIDGRYDTVVTLGDSGDAKLGQTVVAIGNALGEYSNSISVGIISGLDRDISATGANGEREDLNGVIQTDASINPGNSGGPLVDLAGNVLGINVATVAGSSNISFSIPINTVKSVIEQFI